MLTPILIIALRLIKEIIPKLKKAPKESLARLTILAPLIKKMTKRTTIAKAAKKPELFPDNGKDKIGMGRGKIEQLLHTLAQAFAE